MTNGTRVKMTFAVGEMRRSVDDRIEPKQKQGKWIDEKINEYTSRTYCSVCKESAPFIYVTDDPYGNRMHGETRKTKYCPHCGADMREDKE